MTDRVLRLVLAALFGALTVCTAASAQREDVSGWREVVFTVSEFEPWIDAFTHEGGWEVRWQGPVSGGQAAFWGVGEDAGAVDTVLLGNIGAQTGFIRLVRIENGPRIPVRSDTQPWDSGGIFNINVRTTDIQAGRDALLARGWSAVSEPYRFTFGPFDVSEWFPRGPEGIRVALIERHAPELEGWSNLVRWSRAFNSTQIVADMSRARAFYEEVLGFEVYLEATGTSDEPSRNVFGLPADVITGIDREVVILHPQGTNEGSVELLQFVGADGRDVSARADPVRPGIAALRFPVEDAAAFAEEIIAKGVMLASPLTRFHLEPYGEIEVFAVRAPDGARLEFFERLD